MKVGELLEEHDERCDMLRSLYEYFPASLCLRYWSVTQRVLEEVYDLPRTVAIERLRQCDKVPKQVDPLPSLRHLTRVSAGDGVVHSALAFTFERLHGAVAEPLSAVEEVAEDGALAFHFGAVGLFREGFEEVEVVLRWVWLVDSFSGLEDIHLSKY